MISIRLVIYTYLCVEITSKVQGVVPMTDDEMKEAYYTTVLQTNVDIIPQDVKDAQTIIDSDRKEEVVASIISYRDNKIRRFAINKQILLKIPSSVTFSSGKQSSTRYYWVSDFYTPQRNRNSTNEFMDLCFGLLQDENTVLSQYLENFYDGKDETWITIGMVLTKDMKAMVTTYDKNHYSITFDEQRNGQREPYKNMLRIWVRRNRDPIEAGDPNSDAVGKDAADLKAEQDKGHWHDKCRDKLEDILMYKSIKYSRAVITKFESLNNNRTIDTILNDCINNETRLNKDLADAYSSIARYVKDKYKYIADLLSTYSDGSDRWAAWIMSISVLQPKEWSKVNDAFRTIKGHENDSLSQFITKQLASHKVMAEMIATVIDPKFKPTYFSEDLIGGGPAPPPVPPTVPAPSPGPPPAPPTTPAPAPATPPSP